MTSGMPRMPEDQLEMGLKALRPYMIFSAANGKLGPFGGLNFVDEATLRDTFELIDRNGQRHKPMPPADISPDAQNLIAMVKSGLVSSFGQMGAGMQFIFLPALDAEGLPLVSVREEGRFSVNVRERWDSGPLDCFPQPGVLMCETH